MAAPETPVHKGGGLDPPSRSGTAAHHFSVGVYLYRMVCIGFFGSELHWGGHHAQLVLPHDAIPGPNRFSDIVGSRFVFFKGFVIILMSCNHSQALAAGQSLPHEASTAKLLVGSCDAHPVTTAQRRRRRGSGAFTSWHRDARRGKNRPVQLPGFLRCRWSLRPLIQGAVVKEEHACRCRAEADTLSRVGVAWPLLCAA